MSEYIWVKEKGLTGEKELFSELRDKIAEDSLFLACGTNFFKAGHAIEEELREINIGKLLELRVFSDNQEIYYSRSSIGENFQWRIASEKNVPKNHYIVQYQTIDINSKRTKEAGNPTDRYGNRILFTTVGGKYVLTIAADADTSEVICYLIYDKNGIAKIVDYRMKGFVTEALLGKEVNNYE